MREKNIIRSLKNGEAEYIEYIVSSYYGEIYSYLCRKMGNEIEAQDVTQEVFAKFFANLHIYQERGKLKNYLFKLATNASNDVFRKSRPAITFDEIGELQDTQMTPWEITEQKEEKVRVKQALQALSIHQREVIILRFYHELPFGDIGELNASFVFAADNVFIYLSSPYNFKVWQYLLVMLGLSFLRCMGVGCLTLFVSSKCRSALSASMVSLALVYVPILAFKMLGQNEGIVPNILRLFHGAVMGVRTLFSNYFPVHIGNVTLTIPVISITLLCVSSVFFGIFAFRGFQKHQVQN